MGIIAPVTLSTPPPVDEATVEGIVQRIGPGIATVLNYHAQNRYGKPFTRLLLEDPQQAYTLLEALMGQLKARILWRVIEKKLVHASA